MAGEEIDATLGVKLGFSTLASAGLGNLVSDVAGIGFADQLEVSWICNLPNRQYIACLQSAVTPDEVTFLMFCIPCILHDFQLREVRRCCLEDCAKV